MFTGHESHAISTEDAGVMTKAYRDAQTAEDYSKGCYFSKDELIRILNQDDSVGVRFYFAINDNSKLDLVAAAVKADGDDILDNVLDHSLLCPPHCSSSNVLNS